MGATARKFRIGRARANIHPAIGLAIDDNRDGTPNYLESGSVGSAALRPHRVRAGETALVRFDWTHPRRWRRLETLWLRISQGRWLRAMVRFSVRGRAFGLFDGQTDTYGRTRRAGGRRLRSRLATLDLRRTRVTGLSRRKLRLVLASLPGAWRASAFGCAHRPRTGGAKSGGRARPPSPRSVAGRAVRKGASYDLRSRGGARLTRRVGLVVTVVRIRGRLVRGASSRRADRAPQSCPEGGGIIRRTLPVIAGLALVITVAAPAVATGKRGGTDRPLKGQGLGDHDRRPGLGGGDQSRNRSVLPPR